MLMCTFSYAQHRSALLPIPVKNVSDKITWSPKKIEQQRQCNIGLISYSLVVVEVH